MIQIAIVLSLLSFSKGEIDNAVKFLEMYVSVAEKAGLQHSLAKAYSAIGIMYNTLVSDTNNTIILLCTPGFVTYAYCTLNVCVYRHI